MSRSRSAGWGSSFVAAVVVDGFFE